MTEDRSASDDLWVDSVYKVGDWKPPSAERYSGVHQMEIMGLGSHFLVAKYITWFRKHISEQMLHIKFRFQFWLNRLFFYINGDKPQMLYFWLLTILDND